MAAVSGFMQVFLAVLVCIISLEAVLGQSFRPQTCQFASKRLPTHIQPERYQVLLDSRSEKKLLHGKVRIHLNIGELGTDPFTPDTEIPDDIVAPDWDLSSTSWSSAVASELLPLKKRRLVKRATGESSRQAGKRPMGAATSSRGIQPAQNQIVINSVDKILYSKLEYYSIISDGSSIRRRKVDIKGTCFDPSSRMLVMSFAENLEPGTRGQLDIVFAGNYRQFKDAYVFANYNDQATGRKIVSFSNRLRNNPTDPAFPSFHEPAFRSIFEMSIIVDAKESGYSTMPIEGEHLLPRTTKIGFDPNDDDFYSHERARGSTSVEHVTAIELSLQSYRKVVRFQPTPLMPCFLVGVASGEYSELSHMSGGGVPIRLIAHTNKHVELAQYLLNMTGRVVDFLEDLFGQPFPMPKLDVMATFDHNSAFVGLIKIKRKFFFPSDGPQITSQRRGIAVACLVRFIVSNYIDMLLPRKWWTDNWFHGVMPFLIASRYTGAILPRYNRILGLQEFTTLSKDRETLDRFEITDNEDMFLEKEKLEKMLVLYEGLEEVAPNLIIGHVTQLMKSNQSRLTNANKILAGLPPFVQAYLYDWARTKGFPIITVTQIERKALAIRQERAVLLDTDTNQLDGHRWPLLLELLVYRNDNQEPDSIKLTWSGQGDQLRVQLPDWFDPHQGHWYIIKKNMGYHRIRYGSASLNLIGQNLRSSRMRSIDMRLMVDDAIGLLEIGYIDAHDLTQTISLFMNEQDLLVVNNLVKGVTLLKRLFPTESTKDRFGWFACAMFQHLFERHGAAPQLGLLEDELASLAAAYDMLVASGSEPIIVTLIDMYRSDPTGWKQGRVPEYLHVPMLSAVAKHGTDQEFTDLLDGFVFGPSIPMPITLLKSLATAAPDFRRVKQLIVRVSAEHTNVLNGDEERKLDSTIYRVMERILVLGFEIDPCMNLLASIDKPTHDRVSQLLTRKEVGFYPSPSSRDQDSLPSNRIEANVYRVRQLNFGIESKLVAFLTNLAGPKPSK